jgi:hypothetical protein
MAITQAQRILDLALAGHDMSAIADMLDCGNGPILDALQDLNGTPSGQASGQATSLSTTGNGTIGGTLSVTGAAAFNGVTPPGGKQGAYTKTYNTAARVIPAATVAAVDTTGSTLTTPYGYAQAQADAIPVAINALAADVLALKKLIVSLVVDSEAVGIAG